MDGCDVVCILVFWLVKNFVFNFGYVLKGIFCEIVFEGEVCVYLNNVIEFFLEDQDFVMLQVEVYVGVCFVGFEGEILGYFFGVYDEVFIDYENVFEVMMMYVLFVVLQLC